MCKGKKGKPKWGCGGVTPQKQIIEWHRAPFMNLS